MLNEQKVNDWSKIVHDLAVEKGWWPEEGRDPAEIVANFHSEISEAWEEYRSGRMETWWCVDGRNVSGNTLAFMQNTLGQPTPKPEGFWVEVADLLIRIMDTMAKYEWKFDISCSPNVETSIPRFIVEQHRRCTSIFSLMTDEMNKQHSVYFASAAIQASLDTASHFNVDLWSLIELKHAYNKTRPVRHGGKKA